MRGTFARSLAVAFVMFAGLFGLEFFLEWRRLGMPGLHEMSWAGTNNAKLVDLLSPMARAYNNVLAMLLATIGLAIPLTANMHTPKLIDMFLRDRINRFDPAGADAFGGALHLVTGAGHVPHMEQPDVVTPLMAAFYRSVAGIARS